MKLIIFSLLILFTFSSHATLYKYTDQNGETIYSDTPPYAGASEITPPQLQTAPAFKPPKKDKDKTPTKAQQKDTRYFSLEISQPKHDATIRNNMGEISIVLGLSPELNSQNGDYINIYLDGRIIKKHTTSLKAKLTEIDRGSHNIKAEVRNKKGKLLKSSRIITVHLHRFSSLHNKPEQNFSNQSTSLNPEKTSP